MKNARKWTSLLLALLLVFALAATAAADGGTTTTNLGSITVDNPRADLTYTAYKIFDVVYEDAADPQHYSYTIKGNSPWYNTVDTYAKDKTHGLTLTEVADTNPTTYVVTIDDINGTNKFSAPSFADALKEANVTDTEYTLQEGNDGKRIASELPLGYYFVKSSDNNALCNLTTTNPAVIIHDKNNVPFEKTGVTRRDVEVGQKLEYTIKGKVPDTTGFKDYTYEITDTMTDGLTFNESSLVVKVGTTDVTNDQKCTILKGTAAAPSTFKVSIKVKDCKVGEDIVVTYNATVNEKAVAVVSTNKAELIYSTNPSTTDTGKLESEHKVYSAQIEIKKFWTDNGVEKDLANVRFKLYKKATSEGQETINYYKYDETTQKVSWVNTIDDGTEVQTDDQGKAYFKGLANGTYYLVETKTPAGFNPLTGPEKVDVNGSETNLQSLTATSKIENKTGAVLPSTGGMGTTVFYVLGAVLVLGAGVLLVTKKRMSRNEG